MADEEAKTLLVVVPNDQLSLAIGRQGQNVRLASRLLGWRIDVKSEQRYANLEDPGYQTLLAVDGIEEPLADQLLARGVFAIEKLADAAVDDLIVIRSIDEEQAQHLIDTAKRLIEEGVVTASFAKEDENSETDDADGNVEADVSEEVAEGDEVEEAPAEAEIVEEQPAEEQPVEDEQK
jgi:N utilization substance protein A